MPAVREAVPTDVPALVALIRELADFEKLSHEVELTEGMLARSLFCESPAVFAHVAVTDEGAIAGMAIWFLTYSTFLGRHGIYLEDLIVAQEFRRQGHATALMKRLAEIANERGYGRFEWAALDWNMRAIDMYEGMGAVAKRDWLLFRMHGDALAGAAR